MISNHNVYCKVREKRFNNKMIMKSNCVIHDQFKGSRQIEMLNFIIMERDQIIDILILNY